MEERLQKYLARAGVLSRRKAEEAILAGKVAYYLQTTKTPSQLNKKLPLCNK